MAIMQPPLEAGRAGNEGSCLLGAIISMLILHTGGTFDEFYYFFKFAYDKKKTRQIMAM